MRRGGMQMKEEDVLGSEEGWKRGGEKEVDGREG